MIDHVTTTGIFSLDGQDFEVENNIWLVGDDAEVLVIDAAHDHRPIVDGRRRPARVAIVATHGHNDHINAAGALADARRRPVWLIPTTSCCGGPSIPDRAPDRAPGRRAVAVRRLERPPAGAPHPGALARRLLPLRRRTEGVRVLRRHPVQRRPGGDRAQLSDFPTIIDSIRTRLLPCRQPPGSCTGHGDETTIGDEAPHLDEWIARGH